MQMQFNKKHCYTITNLLGSTLPCGTSRHDADTIGSSSGEKGGNVLIKRTEWRSVLVTDHEEPATMTREGKDLVKQIKTKKEFIKERWRLARLLNINLALTFALEHNFKLSI